MPSEGFAPIILQSAITANSSGSAIPNTAGLLGFFAYGTFDTSTCKLQWSPDSTNWYDTTGSVTDASGYDVVQVPQGYIRGDVSSVGGSTSVTLGVMRINEVFDV